VSLERQPENPGRQPPAARFLAVRAVAAELGVSECTVRRLIYDGWLVGVRIGGLLRVARASIEEYLEEQRITTK
jgi:excisionase family DNA binding protein